MHQNNFHYRILIGTVTLCAWDGIVVRQEGPGFESASSQEPFSVDFACSCLSVSPVALTGDISLLTNHFIATCLGVAHLSPPDS